MAYISGTGITKQQGEAYLVNRGAACPVCGGSVEGGSMSFEGGEISQRITL